MSDPSRARMNVPTIPAPTISAAHVRALGTRGHASGTAFQAVLVALARQVQRAAARVQRAEASALNLAQQQKVAGVADDLTATAEALREALNAQGRCLLGERRSFLDRVREASERVRTSLVHKPEAGAASWWFALTEAVEALDDAARQVDALAEAQPADTPAAALGREVSARLGLHREALLAEAVRWVG